MTHVRRRFLIVIVLVAIGALPAPAAAEQRVPSWHTFSSLNGLAGNIVQAIWEDPQGRIWFGTENGVARYDGATWQIYRTVDGLVDDNVWSIAGDADAVWFATSNGLSRLRQGRWERFSTADGLPNNDVRTVLVSRDGSVWIGTFGSGIARRAPGAARWEQLDLTPIIKNRDVAVQSAWESSSGALWFGTSAFGAIRLTDGRLTLFAFGRGGRNTVWAIGAWPGGDIWLATFLGIVRAAPDDDSDVTAIKAVVADLPLESTEFLAFAADGPNSLWFGTRASGVVHYADGAWQRFTSADGLSRDYVLSILADRWGRVWFGTRGGGVTMYDPRPLAGAAQLRANVTARDIQHGTPINLSNPTLQFDQNNLQFTFTAQVGWRPAQEVGFHYWLSSDAQPFPTAKVAFGTATPDPHATATVNDFINLAPGHYTLHVMPAVDGVVGVEGAYPFSIRSAPPNFAADALRIKADAALISTGATLAPALFGTTRQVQLLFAADGNAATANLHYEYRIDAGDWQPATGASAIVSLEQGSHAVAMRAIAADGNASNPISLTVIVPAPFWLTILLYLAIIAIPGAVGGAAGAFWYRRWAQRQALMRAVRGHVIPYDVGPLISDPERFIGRRHILDTILGGIDHNSFYVYGEKRIGKSSLLTQLRQRLLRRNDLALERMYVPVFRNIQDVPQELFWLALIRAIADAVPGAESQLHARTKHTGYDDFDAQDDLAMIIEQLRTQFAPRRPLLVLLLDEIDTLQRYEPIVRQRFRAFCQHVQDAMQVVLVGVLPPRAEVSETSPWYNIFAPIALEPLDPDDGLYLIRSYNQNPYRYTPTAEQALLAAGDRKPFDTQWLCAESVKHMLAAGHTRVTIADVEQAIRMVVGERRREYAAFWQQVPATTQADVRAALNDGGTLASDQAALGAYDRLIEAGLALKGPSGYRLTALFQAWLRESTL